jgi:TAT (twin-arginine translocation) pathway signal sequence
MEKLTRRSFLKAAGVATGAAVVVGPTGLTGAASASAAEEPAVAVDPSGATPAEMVVAYIRDEKRGEVTVLWGENEQTYRDRALARRLKRAARHVGAR